MKLRLTLVFLALFLRNNSQSSVEKYIINNSISLNSIGAENSEFQKKFLDHNFYIYSEIHNTKGVGFIQSRMNDYLFNSKSVTSFFIEYPVSLYKDFYLLMTKDVADTVTSDFDCFYGNKTEDGYVFRNLYSNFKKYKFHFVPINNVFPGEISVGVLSELFPKIESDKHIKKDFKSLKRIRFNPFITNRSKFKYYLEYRKKVLENEKIYLQVLGSEDFARLKIILEGISISKDVFANEFGSILSEKREEFLFRNISDSLSGHNQTYISINGHFHTTSSPNECNCLPRYEVLSARVKKLINTCVVYFTNLSSEDDFADLLFKDERNLLFSFVIKGNPMIIFLKGENTPFVKMSKNYDYIVAW